MGNVTENYVQRRKALSYFSAVTPHYRTILRDGRVVAVEIVPRGVVGIVEGVVPLARSPPLLLGARPRPLSPPVCVPSAMWALGGLVGSPLPCDAGRWSGQGFGALRAAPAMRALALVCARVVCLLSV